MRFLTGSSKTAIPKNPVQAPRRGMHRTRESRNEDQEQATDGPQFPQEKAADKAEKRPRGEIYHDVQSGIASKIPTTRVLGRCKEHVHYTMLLVDGGRISGHGQATSKQTCVRGPRVKRTQTNLNWRTARSRDPGGPDSRRGPAVTVRSRRRHLVSKSVSHTCRSAGPRRLD